MTETPAVGGGVGSLDGRRVGVVGGGLAGISAAIALAEAGATVTLFEARPRLGGATHSFRREGLTVDNGQHVFLRCYTAYRGLLDRLGVADLAPLQRRFDIPVVMPAGRRASLRRSNLPAPLHLARSLAAYAPLAPADRVTAFRTALALGRLDPDDPALDHESFGAWLARRGVRPGAVRGLWDLLITAALNTRASDASAALSAMVIQRALLCGRDAADIGVPAVPLSELHAEPAARLLVRLGVEVRTKAKVRSVRPLGGRFVLDVEGDHVDTDACVLAVPHRQAAPLLPEEAAREGVRFAALGASPIVNVHVIYDRRITSLPFAAAVDSPAQWLFDRTRIAGVDAGQYLAVSVSAAGRYIDAPTSELRGTFLAALEDMFPAAHGAEVRSFFVTRERRATFRQAPGSRALRPPAETRLPGLLIAGAWTDTGWPDTMEGAVRSGLQAARLAREHLFRVGGIRAAGAVA
ncbi:MAG: hydroxysqualene dehydroxylase HpnE [Streptosporangiaceae bacterium]